MCWLSDRDNCEIIVKYAERAKEVAKAKEVRVIGAKDLAEDRRMEAQQDACNIR